MNKTYMVSRVVSPSYLKNPKEVPIGKPLERKPPEVQRMPRQLHTLTVGRLRNAHLRTATVSPLLTDALEAD